MRCSTARTASSTLVPRKGCRPMRNWERERATPSSARKSGLRYSQGASSGASGGCEPPGAAPGGSHPPLAPEDAPWLYLKPLFLAELGVARSLSQLRIGLHPLRGTNVDEAVRAVEQRMRLELADGQRNALKL